MVQGLRAAGWDLVRGVDLYSQDEDDEVHFARAAQARDAFADYPIIFLKPKL